MYHNLKKPLTTKVTPEMVAQGNKEQERINREAFMSPMAVKERQRAYDDSQKEVTGLNYQATDFLTRGIFGAGEEDKTQNLMYKGVQGLADIYTGTKE